MTDFFRALLNRSVSAGILILVIILLRVLLKRAPKWLHCLLWAVAALRLILPTLPESALSLNPQTELITEASYSEPAVLLLPAEHSAGEVTSPGELHPVTVVQLEKPRTEPLTILGWVWFGGLCVMLGYAVFSTEKLRHKVGASVREKGNVFLCDGISSPFILGIVFPRIYLPSEMDRETREHVLAHEQAHLSRGDQLWKPLGWLLLSVYWFHPLVWLGYILLCRDIELACDEKVVRQMETPEKAAYSQALLNCSLPRRMVAACPLAFGETGVKTRVKNVLNYRKPALWVILAAVVLCIAAAVCFLTKPKEESIFGYQYSRGLTYDHWVGEPQWGCPLPPEDIRGVVLDQEGNLCLTLNNGEITKAGQLTEYRPTKQNFDDRYHVSELGFQLKRRMVRRAYRCLFTVPWSDYLFWADVLDQRDGTLRLAVGWQDEEGLTDEYSDDSSLWWEALLYRDGTASAAVRPSVSGCAAAVLRERLSDASAIVTGEIDSLKTFDSLILEPTGEPFDEIWKYSIVFDPTEIVKGREPIEVLIGAESVGIDGWKYVSPNMEGLLEWAEGKFHYFIEEEPASALPEQKPELRITGWQGDALAACVGCNWRGSGFASISLDTGYSFVDEQGNRLPAEMLPLQSDAVLKTVVPIGTHKDAYREVSLHWEEAKNETAKAPDRLTIRRWDEDWDTGKLTPVLVPTDGKTFKLVDGCHVYEIMAQWNTADGVDWIKYNIELQYLAHNSTADGLWRQPPKLYIPADAVWLWQGTYSWDYDFGGVDASGSEMDCASPWLLMKDQPEYIPALTAFAGDRVYIVPEPGGDQPQRMAVYIIDPSQWGEIAPERTEIKISADGSIILPDGEYLYEVAARWQEEGYHGTCWYAFYCDSRSAKTGAIERMGSSTPETILETFSRYPVDENTLSEALQKAAEAGPTETPEAFTDYYEIEVYFSGGAAGYTGEDEHLHLRAGLEEGLVEVFFKPRLGKTDTGYFRNAELYSIVRGSCGIPDSVDADAYERYGEILNARAADVTERLNRNAGAGSFTGYAITELTPLDAFTRNGAEYEVCRWDAAFTIENAAKAGWSGGMWMDSLGRVRGVEQGTVFAVRHGEDGDKTVFLSSGLLYDDMEAGRAAVVRMLGEN